MRNESVGLVIALVLASTMAANGCGSNGTGTGKGGSSGGGTTANGGSSGSAGPGGAGSSGSGGSSSGTSQPATCPGGTPCGGDLAGTWNVTTSCLNLGNWDLTTIGSTCKSVPLTGSLHVSGTWIADSKGNYTDNTTTTGSITFPLADSCLSISSTPVECSNIGDAFSSSHWTATCSKNASGQCNCSATTNQTGGIGVISAYGSDSGDYTTSGNGLKIDNNVDYTYCVSGNTLTLTPATTLLPVTGTIVLQKSGPGTGGATASGGQAGGGGGGAGSGGTSAMGGTRGGGGATGSGGTRVAGGTTGSGGFGGAAGQSASGGGARGGGGAAGSGGAGGGGGRAGSGGTRGGGGAAGSGGTSATGGTTAQGPCDIYGAANNPCVAAHSMVRALYGAYNGKLYQVRKTDGTTKDILTLSAGGIADTAPQDSFCSGSSCVITVVYDQTPKGNHLWYQGSTEVPASTSSSAAKATDSVNVGGHKVYSLYINAGNCYWHDGSKSGMATGSQPEGMYMVTSSRHANSGCCFDYGNSETDRSADGEGSMDAINFSTTTTWGTGAGSGPWVMADLEYGLFSQGSSGKNQNDPTQTAPFVTAVLKNDGSKEYALRGSDATSGSTLSTYYKGALPGGWSPMRKQGAIILGCGGDCCKPSGGANLSSGIFFEGAVVTGYPSDATEDAVQANIVAAGYGK